MDKVFISYKRSGGTAWAEMLRLGLLYFCKDSFRPENIIMDVHNNVQDWHAAIDKAIRECTFVVIIIHKDLQDTIHENEDVWLEEIDLAIKYKRVIIPFLVDGLSEGSEELSKILNADERLVPLKQLCNKYQNATYTEGKCEGSIIALKEKFKDDEYTYKKVTIKTSKACHLNIPECGYVSLPGHSFYDYKWDWLIDHPIKITVTSDSDDKELEYHFCLEEYVDNEFRELVKKHERSTFYRYIIIGKDTKEFTLEWKLLSQTMACTMGSPLYDSHSAAMSVFCNR